MWQCESRSVKVWKYKCESVKMKVWKCESVKVWKRKCESVKEWKWESEKEKEWKWNRPLYILLSKVEGCILGWGVYIAGAIAHFLSTIVCLICCKLQHTNGITTYFVSRPINIPLSRSRCGTGLDLSHVTRSYYFSGPDWGVGELWHRIRSSSDVIQSTKYDPSHQIQWNEVGCHISVIRYS